MRRGGIERLTVRSLILDGDEPCVIIAAGAANKYKNERTVPLKIGTAAQLKEHIANKLPDASVFRMPCHRHSAKMLRKDLEAARGVWINQAATLGERQQREQSNFLKYKDDAGRYLDFHGLRHTRGVWLFEHHKARPREVQDLMGVGSLALVDRYTRSFKMTNQSIIERGPDLSDLPDLMQMKATGTDNIGIFAPGFLPSFLPETGQTRTLADCCEQDDKKNLRSKKKSE